MPIIAAACPTIATGTRLMRQWRYLVRLTPETCLQPLFSFLFHSLISFCTNPTKNLSFHNLPMSTVRDSFHYPAIQIRQLFELIQRKCETSLLNKKRLRMLATAEKLQIYLQAAFDHFAKDLTTPFDLIKEALKHNPVPRGFGGNILTLPLLMQENSATPAHFGTAGTFTDMAPILASCFHLDSVRQNLLGNASFATSTNDTC